MVELQLICSACSSPVFQTYQMYFYFQSLSFKEFLKEKQQTVCSMEQMVCWVNLKKTSTWSNHPYTWWFTIGKKKAFSLKCSGRSCNTKHTAPVPVVPLCKINTQLEKQKQTKLKSPSHHFVCKKETGCCLWSHHELLECLYPTVPDYYFWAEGILPATLGSQLHVHSIPSLTGNSWQGLWLSLKWCWNLPKRFMAKALGWLCCVLPALMWHRSPADEHVLLTFGFLAHLPFPRLLRKNITYCGLSYQKEVRWVLVLSVWVVSSQITPSCSSGPLCCPSVPLHHKVPAASCSASAL